MNRPRAQQDRRDRRNSRRKSLQSPKRLRVETLERRRLLAVDTFLPTLSSGELYSASVAFLHAPSGEIETLDLAANRDTRWFDPSDSSVVGSDFAFLLFGQPANRPEDLGQVDLTRSIEQQLASIVTHGETDLVTTSAAWQDILEPVSDTVNGLAGGWGPDGSLASDSFTIVPRPAITPIRIRLPATPVVTGPHANSPLADSPLESSPLGASPPADSTTIQAKPTVDTIIDIGNNSSVVDSYVKAGAARVAPGPVAINEFITAIPTTPSVTFRVEPIMARHHRIELGQVPIAPATITSDRHESTSQTNTDTVTANDGVAAHAYNADESTEIGWNGDSQTTHHTMEREEMFVRFASQNAAPNTSGNTVVALAANAINAPLLKSASGEAPAASLQETEPAKPDEEFKNGWRHAVDLLMASTAGLIVYRDWVSDEVQQKANATTVTL